MANFLRELDLFLTECEQGEVFWKRPLLVCLILIIPFTLLVYWPALDHFIRSDHWVFVVETLNKKTFGELLAYSASFSRSRSIYPGDSVLFRPLFGAIWAVEKWLFGPWPRAWQAVSLVLHLAVSVTLLRLMGVGREVRGRLTLHERLWRYLPGLLMAFFTMSFAIQEMVIWSHIQGYLVFLLAALIALLMAAQVERRGIIGSWLVLFAMVFLFELGMIYTLVFGAYYGLVLWWKGRSWKEALGWFALFAVPVFAHRIANHLDLVSRSFSQDQAEIGAVFARAFSFDTLTNFGRILKYSLLQPFFPAQIQMVAERRLIIQEVPLQSLLREDLWGAVSWVAVSIWTVFSGCAAVGIWHRIRRGRLTWTELSWGILPLALLLGFVCMIVVGRLNVRPTPNQLEGNSYYSYYPLLFFVLGTCWLWEKGRTGIFLLGRRNALYLLVGLFVSLLGLTGYSSVRVWVTNVKYARESLERNESLPLIRKLVEQHGSEPGFSLAFDTAKLGRTSLLLGIPLQTLFFKQFENNVRPKYVVSVEELGVRLSPYEVYVREHSLREGESLFPDLLEIHETFRIYSYRGVFYAVSNEEGLFDPVSGTFTPLMTANDLEGARSQGQKTFGLREDKVAQAEAPGVLQGLLQGEWESSCTAMPEKKSGKIKLSVAGRSLLSETIVHSDAKCAKPEQITFSTGDFDFEQARLFRKAGFSAAGSAVWVVKLREVGLVYPDAKMQPKPGFCGIYDWTPAKLKDVTGKECGPQPGNSELPFRLKVTDGRLRIQPENDGVELAWNLTRSRGK